MGQQLEAIGRDLLPDVDRLVQGLRQGRILAAVYRVATPTLAGTRQGLALRLMIDPKRTVASAPVQGRAS